MLDTLDFKFWACGLPSIFRENTDFAFFLLINGTVLVTALLVKLVLNTNSLVASGCHDLLVVIYLFIYYSFPSGWSSFSVIFRWWRWFQANIILTHRKFTTTGRNIQFKMWGNLQFSSDISTPLGVWVSVLKIMRVHERKVHEEFLKKTCAL